MGIFRKRDYSDDTYDPGVVYVPTPDRKKSRKEILFDISIERLETGMEVPVEGITREGYSFSHEEIEEKISELIEEFGCPE